MKSEKISLRVLWALLAAAAGVAYSFKHPPLECSYEDWKAYLQGDHVDSFPYYFVWSPRRLEGVSQYVSWGNSTAFSSTVEPINIIKNNGVVFKASAKNDIKTMSIDEFLKEDTCEIENGEESTSRDDYDFCYGNDEECQDDDYSEDLMKKVEVAEDNLQNAMQELRAAKEKIKP